MNTKIHWTVISAAAVLGVLIFADAGFAQGAQLGNKVENVTSNIINIAKILGLGVAVIGFIFAGIKYTQGDPAAKDLAVKVGIGVTLIGLAPFIVGAIIEWTS